MNKVILIGRLARDPELRYTPSGAAVCTFTLAVDRSYANQQGNREADFIPIVVWRGLAETCSKYLTKGRLVSVSGRLQVRSFEGKEGQRRYITEVAVDEVQFLERVTQDGQAQQKQGGFEPLDPDDPENQELPF